MKPIGNIRANIFSQLIQCHSSDQTIISNHFPCSSLLFLITLSPHRNQDQVLVRQVFYPIIFKQMPHPTHIHSRHNVGAHKRASTICLSVPSSTTCMDCPL